ncbi:MAG: hypothetical protein ACN6O8_25450, partial [Achromobacter sp.]|uniref:hypothetical protein n=1 Tax=Achromobacter sp. TaxID=134375 RepID=UPI003D02B1E6
SVVVTGGDPQTYAREAHYTFNNAWANVSKITATFGGVGPATIFKNGLHQAALVLNITLVDGAGEQLTDDNSPEFSQFLKNVWFIDYYSREELSWLTFSAVKNQFSAQLYSGRASGAAIDPPPGSHGIENGVVKLTYYVSCAERPASAVDIGQRFRPTAGFGVNVDPPKNQDIYNADGANAQGGLSERATLTLLSAITYTLQDLDCQATLRTNPDTNDEGITDPSEPAPEGNCSRQIDYTFSLTGPTVVKYGANIYEVRVDKNQYSALNGYCVGYRGEHLYTHAAYFWPLNLKDLDGNPIPGSDAREFSLGEYEVSRFVPGSVRFDNSLQGFFITFYGYFGYWYDKLRRRTANIDFKLYDQYGNSGDFHISTDNMPSKYVEFKSWKMLAEGAVGEIPEPQYKDGEGFPGAWNTKFYGNFGKDREAQYVCGINYIIAVGLYGDYVLVGRSDYTDMPSTFSFVTQGTDPLNRGRVLVRAVDSYQSGHVGPYFLARSSEDGTVMIFPSSLIGEFSADDGGNVQPIWARQSIVFQAIHSDSKYICTSTPVDLAECFGKNYIQGDQKFEFIPVDYYSGPFKK